ncbi:hypothetical protein [Vibrio sagamiensis]|uniref:Uncharacterized protein n=1 Tax=Vibrio sagamiensis NBRC 104589 TaxID=1219064 RepID=A0A511QEG0_9VIBR|nr:hypothetical protein [Vibrio sagamiensis]PNQ66585.1 hypothetical protein C1141_08645 [Vibrio agarivorans]GEM75684.1 hypothetical protein VSA01S_17960 [Vibrio sagamiensis NBRC 104589]
MAEILTELQSLKQATQEQSAITQAMTEIVEGQMEKIESGVAEFKQWMEETTAEGIKGEGRYVTEFTVKGDKDTFYPVVFQMPKDDETTIQIYRHYAWNRLGGSDFNATHVASALVILKGQTYGWNGDANYLSTVVNQQRYRRCVAKVAFRAWSTSEKLDLAGASTGYNQHSTPAYCCPSYSGFHLRGGNLTYRIYSNHRINFKLLADNQEIYQNAQGNVVNAKWRAKTVHIDNAEIGDSINDVGENFIGYNNLKTVTQTEA